LAASRPSATTLARLDGAALDEVPAGLGGLSLDHHDRDILGAVGLRDDATGDREVEDGVGELAVLREGDPLAGAVALRHEREAHTGDRAITDCP